jgi:hypothetical protein
MPLALGADILIPHMLPVFARVGHPEYPIAIVTALAILAASFVSTVIYQIVSVLAIKVALGALPMAPGVVHVLSIRPLCAKPSVAAITIADGC